jgi:hypothetical protein
VVPFGFEVWVACQIPPSGWLTTVHELALRPLPSLATRDLPQMLDQHDFDG